MVLDNPNSRRSLAHLVDPIAKLLIKTRITPDALTWFGAGATLVISVVFLSRGDFLLGAVLFGIFSLFDLLDGTMARMLGTSGPWGAFLDSTLDRVSDAAVICGVCFYYANSDLPNGNLVASAGVVALVMGLMTSYARAKAESLNAQCTIGIAERAERNILIWVALLLTSLVTDVMSYAFVTLAIVSTITVIQRIVYVRKQLIL
jgi:CDP-diacylglycerol--glycerol-3-phosphate 3-phosphatidyltransferase